MKFVSKLFLLLTITVAGVSFATPSAEEINAVLKVTSEAILIADVQSELKIQNMINWQVGQYHNISIDAGGFLKGTGTKEVTKEEMVEGSAAIWYVTKIAIMGQNQVSEALMRRSDGKVLKLIVNGEEKDPNQQGDIEIIEQSETSITVPAGTFDCLYIKAKTNAGGQQAEMEAWINPIDVNLDGTLKMVIKGGLLPITLELQSFGSK